MGAGGSIFLCLPEPFRIRTFPALATPQLLNSLSGRTAWQPHRDRHPVPVPPRSAPPPRARPRTPRDFFIPSHHPKKNIGPPPTKGISPSKKSAFFLISSRPRLRAADFPDVSISSVPDSRPSAPAASQHKKSSPHRPSRTIGEHVPRNLKIPPTGTAQRAGRPAGPSEKGSGAVRRGWRDGSRARRAPPTRPAFVPLRRSLKSSSSVQILTSANPTPRGTSTPSPPAST